MDYEYKYEYKENIDASSRNDSWDANICSRAVIERVRQYYEDNRDSVKSYKKYYTNTPEYKIRKKAYDKRYEEWRSSWGENRYVGKHGWQVINLLNIQGDVFA